MKTAQHLPFDFDLDSINSDIPGGLEILNSTALSSGKRFRPLLLMKISRILGLSDQLAKPYAIAAERVHNATLLHDDVIDESKLRRGRATLNSTGENKKAILAGDLLLARALQEIAKGGQFGALSSLFDVLVELAEGEWLQLEARNRTVVEERHLREVARKKTGSLIGWCCEAPAILIGSSPQTIRSLKQFGIHLGLAFQLSDDCLDFDEASGKPYAQDLREGQVNFVVHHLLERSPHLVPVVEGIMGLGLPSDPPREFKNQIQISLTQVFAKAELELATAKAALAQGHLPIQSQYEIAVEIIVPFEKQIADLRGRIKCSQPH